MAAPLPAQLDCECISCTPPQHDPDTIFFTFTEGWKAVLHPSQCGLINMAYQRNWAYRVAEPDPPFKGGRPNPHVHWHLTPRHAQPVEFGGLIFDDPTFGEPFEWRTVDVPAQIRRAIIERLRAQLGVLLE